MHKVKEFVEQYIEWDYLRMILIRCLFLIIAICMSALAYQWAVEFKGATAFIIACALIAYDVVLVPRFPMFVHYVNSILATVLSIGFMVLIGYLTIGSSVAGKNGTEFSALLERIEARSERIERLEAGKAACILADDMKCMKAWTAQNAAELRDLNDGYESMLEQKQDYEAYSDPTVAPLKWLASVLEIGTNDLNAYIFPALWIAILSIQTTLSAAAHGIRIYRPSLLRGLLVLLTMIFGVNHRYVENFKHGIGEISTDVEEPESGKSTTPLKKAA